MFGTYRTSLALMVLAEHLGVLPFIGDYAVFGFYVLSGYLMTLIMQTTYGYTWSGRGRYALNRFLRIYPPYWIAALIAIVLVLLVGTGFAADYSAPMLVPRRLATVLSNAFIAFPSTQSTMLVPPAWALTVELSFYVLIGLGISRYRRAVDAWLGASVLYHIVAAVLHLDRYSTILAASLPFATGAWIFHYKDRLYRALIGTERRLTFYLPAIVLGAVLLNWAAAYVSHRSMGLFFYFNLALSAFIVLVLTQSSRLPLVDHRLDKLIGNWSYPIYLVHSQAGVAVLWLLDLAGINSGYVFVVGTLLLTAILTWLVTQGIEKPLELARTRVKRRGSAAAQAQLEVVQASGPGDTTR